MKNNITTLILNLLVSENRMHRSRIAESVVDFLNINVADFGGIERQVRKHFISRIEICVENPTSQCRIILFAFADFYKDVYIEYVQELNIAA